MSLNLLDRKPRAATSVDDRRREPRMPADGLARLTVDGLGGWELEGTLLDTSESGFRLEHTRGGLTTGTEVRFEFGGRRGRAKVCWNRIANGRVESGFYITSQRHVR